MQHFANFIRLSDKNLNSARGLLKQVKKGRVNNWSELSGYDDSKISDSLKVHDNLQHKLVDKPLFKAATGVDPNTFFSPNSPQAKTSLMPLVQNKEQPRDKREQVNETIEQLVNVVNYPDSPTRLPYDTSMLLPKTNFEAVMPYVRKKFSQADRLAATDSVFQLENKTNPEFRDYYLKKMKGNEQVRNVLAHNAPRLASKNLNYNATTGDKLRAKLKDRESYTKAFDSELDLSNRENALNTYRKTGLMPR